MINLLTWWNGFLSKKTAIKTNQLQSLNWREGKEKEGSRDETISSKELTLSSILKKGTIISSKEVWPIF